MAKKNQVKIFVSYSQKDEEWRRKLETSLSTLKTQKLISTWHDREIKGGEEWEKLIDENITKCDVVLLLISPDFLASKYCTEIEVKRAMERHEAGDAIVIPIITRPSDWQETEFAKLQALPSNGIAISKWPDADDAFLDIVRGLRSILKKIDYQDNDPMKVDEWRKNLLLFKKKEKHYSIGVDVGTTKIAAALISIEDGKDPFLNIENIIRKEHDEKRNTEGVLEKIKIVIDQVIEKENITINDVDAIGVGLPGQVRRTDGLLRFAPGLQITNHNFCSELQHHYNVPVHADNDVNCATFAELIAGHGKYFDDFVCIFVGTGIGAGIVIDNKIVRGNNYASGEVGHMKIDFRPDARECTCGGKGCYEEYASARAIIRLARIKIFDVIERKKNSKLKDFDPRTIEPKDIVNLIKDGDEEAKELARDIANHLSIGIANIANILNPKAIVLGGGVIEGFYDFPDFEKTISKQFKEYAIQACAAAGLVKTSFKCSENGSQAPIIGAALLPFEKGYAD